MSNNHVVNLSRAPTKRNTFAQCAITRDGCLVARSLYQVRRDLSTANLAVKPLLKTVVEVVAVISSAMARVLSHACSFCHILEEKCSSSCSLKSSSP